jgi:hypothetical protein
LGSDLVVNLGEFQALFIISMKDLAAQFPHRKRICPEATTDGRHAPSLRGVGRELVSG